MEARRIQNEDVLLRVHKRIAGIGGLQFSFFLAPFYLLFSGGGGGSAASVSRVIRHAGGAGFNKTYPFKKSFLEKIKYSLLESFSKFSLFFVVFLNILSYNSVFCCGNYVHASALSKQTVAQTARL